MKNLKFAIHPLFLVLGIVMVFSSQGLLFLIYLTTISLHELGHFCVACRLGYRLEKFCLLPQGALLFGESQFFSYKDEIKIAIAGPLVNVLLTICTVALWWIFPISYAYSETFAFCNITTALFNFLPILPLDGGRCFVAYCSAYHKRKSAIKFCNIFGVILSIFFATMFVVSCFFEINSTFLIVAIFLVVGIFSPTKSNVYVNGFSKRVKQASLKKGIKIKSTVISENSQITKLIPLLSNHSFNMVYVANEFLEIVGVLHESDLEKILENNTLDKKIKDIIY